MTIFVEWPFVLWCFPKESRNWKQSLRASWLIQTCSYVVLFTGYWLVSGASIYSRVEVVCPSEIELSDNLALFYLGTDGRVYRNHEILGDFVSTNRNDRLDFEPTPDATNAWDLHVILDARHDADTLFIKLASALAGGAASVDEQRQNQGRVRETWFNFGKGVNVGMGTNAIWYLRSGFWPIEGLRVRNERATEQYRFSWETPFSKWPVRNVMQLPNERAIFQLGEDQICVLDLRTKRIALLARGQGPTALLK